MEHSLLISLGSIVVLGVSAQVIAWRLKIPSILLLLVFGFLAGPVTGFVSPNEVFGDLLFPLVSISVAIILFEGGLSLRFKDIPGLSTLIFNLITIGLLITFICSSALAYYLLGLNFEISILLGSILTVTGPTVIIPLINHLRPKQPVGKILKWEGILIDPVGAILAVLVFESIYNNYLNETTSFIAFGLLKTLITGVIIGFLMAFLLGKVIKHYLIPDYLQNPFALSMVILTYVVSDYFQAESGLLSVTLMGIILANSSSITVRHILEFKETLRVFLIACLFITLAARLELSDFADINFVIVLIFLILLIFVIRPLGVFISSIGTDLKFKEKLFISFIAPRGIVAAAVSSLFAFQLMKNSTEQANLLVPYVFIVIVGTVVFYSLIAAPLARFLYLKEEDPNGVLFVGANSIAIAIAKELRANKVKVVLVDTNPRNVYLAIKEDLEAIHGDFLSAYEDKKIDLSGIGMLLAMTPNNEANSLAALKFSEELNRSHVFQLIPPDTDPEKIDDKHKHLRGRFLFTKEADYYHLEDLINENAKVQTLEITKVSEADNLIPMFLISPTKDLEVIAIKSNLNFKAREGWKVIGIKTTHYNSNISSTNS